MYKKAKFINLRLNFHLRLKLMTTQKYRSDPVEIANTFCNNYFTNVGHNLPKKILNSPNCPQTFLSGNFPNSIFLKLATESEIMEVASSFSSGKAAGFDTIPRSIIKQSINVISQPLTNIINLSIIYGIVPDEIKISWKSHIYIYLMLQIKYRSQLE